MDVQTHRPPYAGHAQTAAHDRPEDKIGLFKLLREDPEARRILLKIYKQDFDRFGFSTEIPPISEHA